MPDRDGDAAGLRLRAALPARDSRAAPSERPRAAQSTGPQHLVRCWVQLAGGSAMSRRRRCSRSRNLAKRFAIGGGCSAAQRQIVRAVDGRLASPCPSGASLGLVGESGCGKSTVGARLLRLIEPDAGRVDLRRHRRLAAPRRGAARSCAGACRSCSRIRTRRSIRAAPSRQALDEPLRVHGVASARAEIAERCRTGLAEVGLPSDGDRPLSARVLRRPAPAHRHRARAGARAASCIVADEPVSALDVSVQAQILQLLEALRERRGAVVPVRLARPRRGAPLLRPRLP